MYTQLELNFTFRYLLCLSLLFCMVIVTFIPDNPPFTAMSECDSIASQVES